jgi:hypothetical protein
MVDLGFFRMSRSPQRLVKNSTNLLDLGGGGRFVAELISLIPEPGAIGHDDRTDALYERAQALASALLDGLSADALAQLMGERAAPVSTGRYLRLALVADDLLSGASNAPDPIRFDEDLGKAMSQIWDRNIDLATFKVEDDWDQTWSFLVDLLCAAVLLPHRGEIAGRLARLLLVLGLLHDRFGQGRPFPSRETIFAAVRHRTPLLPSPPFPQVLPEARVRLVRRATVSDLFVVRSEWRSYEAAEIAEITNVLAGETLEYTKVTLDEKEIIDVSTDESARTDEQTDESREQSELAEETQNQLTLAVNSDSQMSTRGQIGAMELGAQVGLSVDFSVSNTKRQATQLARDAMSRVLARVETRRRTERTERLLTRAETTDRHELKNTDNKHARGIYRWVNRIDRYQVVRYPDRFQLEFQLPEPGVALRRLLSGAAPGAMTAPGAFTLKPSDIKRDNWQAKAAEYKVVGIPAPPEETTAISAALHGELSAANSNDARWSVAPAVAEEEIALPPGYEVTGVAVQVHAHPMLGKFKVEMSGHDGAEDREVFHSIEVSVNVAGILEGAWHQPDTKDTQQPFRTLRKDAILEWTVPTTRLQALGKPIRNRLPVSVIAAGAEAVSASALISCTLSKEEFAGWQQTVYDVLLGAHQRAADAYHDEQARRALRGQTALRERSPARHTELIRDEIRRLVLAWLTVASPFPGRPAVQTAGPNPGEDTDIDAALEVAGEVQFLEQAFEWQNLVYVCYPYYWARPSEWDALRTLDTGDPDLGRFLRAGSARVILPARPGFQEAVEHWLLFRQPWNGGPPPVPGDKLHVSVAQEIRDQLLPPDGGDPGESWEARLPTSFRWLDSESDLPTNAKGVLGQPPNQPKTLLSDARP